MFRSNWARLLIVGFVVLGTTSEASACWKWCYQHRLYKEQMRKAMYAGDGTAGGTAQGTTAGPGTPPAGGNNNGNGNNGAGTNGSLGGNVVVANGNGSNGNNNGGNNNGGNNNGGNNNGGNNNGGTNNGGATGTPGSLGGGAAESGGVAGNNDRFDQLHSRIGNLSTDLKSRFQTLDQKIDKNHNEVMDAIKKLLSEGQKAAADPVPTPPAPTAGDGTST